MKQLVTTNQIVYLHGYVLCVITYEWAIAQWIARVHRKRRFIISNKMNRFFSAWKSTIWVDLYFGRSPGTFEINVVVFNRFRHHFLQIQISKNCRHMNENQNTIFHKEMVTHYCVIDAFAFALCDGRYDLLSEYHAHNMVLAIFAFWLNVEIKTKPKLIA